MPVQRLPSTGDTVPVPDVIGLHLIAGEDD